MIAIDTNLLIRFLVKDNIEQFNAVKNVFGSGEPIFVTYTVLLESEWVLRSIYNYPVSSVARSFYMLLGLENVEIQNEMLVTEAVGYYSKGFDFGDALHCLISGKGSKFLTFDKKFAKLANRFDDLNVQILEY